ncbi:hypothetical protein PQI66_14695 [Corynebacterium sp. USCH3]|uniref:hypothetical protein n=1 Tax=Corynebacterium sp. USCH3 TaxID=3024840 RepID=UPI0030AADEAB
MAHYDIYQSLGLDRSAPSGQLDRELADRLAAAPSDDPAAVDELTTARAVLGNDARRSLYDQRLADPNAEDIDVASLKELAALDVGGDVPSSQRRGQFQQQAGQFARTAGAKTTGAGRQVQDSFRQSKGLAIGITAVVTAVVVLLVGWGIGALTGGGSGVKEDKDAIALVDDLLKQNTSEDLRSWLRENTAYQFRDEIMEGMNVGDGNSDSFNGMDAFFSGSGLHAKTTLNVGEQLPGGTGVDETEDLAAMGLSEEEADSRLIVGVAKDSGNYGGLVALVEQGGNLKVLNIVNRPMDY